jgi:CBS domain-containing protein
MVETARGSLPPTQRGRRGRGGELLPAPLLEANGAGVTGSEHPPPARNGKSAFWLQKSPSTPAIPAARPLARSLNLSESETMETTVSSIATNPASLPEAPAAQSLPEQVGDRARALPVKVPSWFTAGAALRVAQLKGVEHLLVLDRGRVMGAIGRAELAAAPPTDPLGRWIAIAPATVEAQVSVSEARQLMASLGLTSLVVTAGPLLLGLVTRDDVSDQEERAAG